MRAFAACRCARMSASRADSFPVSADNKKKARRDAPAGFFDAPRLNQLASDMAPKMTAMSRPVIRKKKYRPSSTSVRTTELNRPRS